MPSADVSIQYHDFLSFRNMFLIIILLCCLQILVHSFDGSDMRPYIDDRIVGGVPVDITFYKYHGSLQRWHRHLCGVALISDRWVLTAAHCTRAVGNPAPRHALTVRLGSSFSLSEGFLSSVARVIDHPLYNPSVLTYDISLIQLGSPVQFGNTIEPIALPKSNQPMIPGSTCTITGWGTLVFAGSSPARLHMVQVPLISNESCEQYYANISQIGPGRITYDMMCAGSPYGGRDACQGDSGGPLVNNGVLTGIVSWGYQCAVAQAPGVYANVPALRDWIQENSGL